MHISQYYVSKVVAGKGLKSTNGRWKTSLRRVYSIDDWRLEEMSLDDGIVVAPLASSDFAPLSPVALLRFTTYYSYIIKNNIVALIKSSNLTLTVSPTW